MRAEISQLQAQIVRADKARLMQVEKSWSNREREC